jgi:prepilin-type N-terminal cleavage/methylation domain-containing protein
LDARASRVAGELARRIFPEEIRRASSPVTRGTPHHSDKCYKRRGFTLTELIVVMGIIILIIAIAVPAIRSLTGTRSVDAGFNTLSAMVTRAREEAVGIQDVRGVMFYLNAENDRVEAVIVQDTPPPVTATGPQPTYYLDVVPNRDYLPLPAGIGVQTVNNCTFNGTGPTASRTSDGYLGYNPASSYGTQTENMLYGGVILFDGNGRLISATYGFKLFDNTNTQNPTGMAQLLKIDSPTPTLDMVPTYNGALLSSQFGFVLYDREAFKAQGFTDGDTYLDPTVTTYGTTATANSEASEEVWLDANSAPILVNRYNGTLIRAE